MNNSRHRLKRFRQTPTIQPQKYHAREESNSTCKLRNITKLHTIFICPYTYHSKSVKETRLIKSRITIDMSIHISIHDLVYHTHAIFKCSIKRDIWWEIKMSDVAIEMLPKS